MTAADRSHSLSVIGTLATEFQIAESVLLTVLAAGEWYGAHFTWFCTPAVPSAVGFPGRDCFSY